MKKYGLEEVLEYHCLNGKPGKVCLSLTKPCDTVDDLSLAYTPGVAHVCHEIAKDPILSYKYTGRGNTVAVITNGSAILGLGDLGPLAAKPVMEGKSMLFKKFAGLDSCDIEIRSRDVDEIVKAVSIMQDSWGGINLEDIKAPECFVIEQELQKLCDIPVFHDDQHGTAIVVVAGLINAVSVAQKSLQKCRVVINGAGAAGIACGRLLRSMGCVNIIMCDSNGVISYANNHTVNVWKQEFMINEEMYSLSDALNGADIFIGLSVKDLLKKDHLLSMNKNPIIFALANPEPEIMPEVAIDIRDDVIIATGRSDYPNQVNNALAFPYVFRGALDVGAKRITDRMKIAAAEAIANLATLGGDDNLSAIYPNYNFALGANYIIPTAFDRRLISYVSCAVAKAAIEDGVAQKSLDLQSYSNNLQNMLQL